MYPCDEVWSLHSLRQSLSALRQSRKLLLALVFLSLLLDNVLLTVVVPIIPDYLWSIEHGADLSDYTALIYNETLLLNNTEYGSAPTQAADVMDRFITINGTLLDVTSHVTGLDDQLLDEPDRIVNDVIGSRLAVTNENSEVGWLLSSKAIVQLVCNPFIGPITNRYGSSIPMFAGLVILCLSNIMYAFGETYLLLFMARAVQGIGSACIAIAGMTLLAVVYPEDNERSSAMGFSLGGISLGVLIGYPFGGFMYEFLGKSLPFIILAVVTLIVAGIQVWALKPSIKTKNIAQGTPLHVLLCDPYILIASGAILFPEMAMAMLEPTLPLWLLDTMHAKKWQLGTIFLPDSIGYLIGTTVFAFIAHRMGRWLCTALSLLLMGICLLCIPLASRIPHLIVPHFGLGLSLGMVDVAIMPMLAYLVDKRHIPAYGSVYAIAQVSISLGFALGPSLGGQIVKLIGFPWLIRGMAIANLVYCPLALLLRDPPSGEEHKSILHMVGHQQSGYTAEDVGVNYQKLEED